MTVKNDLKNIDLSYFGKFDVIVIDPPWEQYQKRVQMVKIFIQCFPLQADKYAAWSFEEIG